MFGETQTLNSTWLRDISGVVTVNNFTFLILGNVSKMLA